MEKELGSMLSCLIGWMRTDAVIASVEESKLEQFQEEFVPHAMEQEQRLGEGA